MNAAAFSTPVWLPPDGAASLHEPLKPNEQVDLAIVGGGIMGLSAALHAARAGLSVRVVDAKSVGEGASGLNGGQVIPGLKYDPEWLLEHFGAERGEALIRLCRLDRRRGVRPDRHREARGAVCPQRLDPGSAYRDGLARRRKPRPPVAGPRRRRPPARCGRDRAKRPARAAISAAGSTGARASSIPSPTRWSWRASPRRQACASPNGSKRSALRREAGGWRLATASGAELRAKSVVVATNAYSDGLIPGLAQTIVPLHSFQIATAPLPADLAANNPARRPGGLRFPAHPRLLPQEPGRPAGAWRARTHGAAEKRGRLGASAARDAAALSRACRRRDRTALVRPRCHDAGPSAAHPRAGAGSGHGRRLPGARRRPDDRAWRAPCRIRGDWRCRRTCRSPFRRSGRSRSTPSARSALPRRSPGTACSTRWSAEPARRCNMESA